MKKHGYISGANGTGKDLTLSCQDRRGEPSRLTVKQRESLAKIVEGRHDWHRREVFPLIKERYSIKYSMTHLRKMLGRFGRKYSRS